MGGAAAFKRADFENLFSKSALLKVQANKIRLLVKWVSLHPPPHQCMGQTDKEQKIDLQIDAAPYQYISQTLFIYVYTYDIPAAPPYMN